MSIAHEPACSRKLYISQGWKPSNRRCQKCRDAHSTKNVLYQSKCADTGHRDTDSTALSSVTHALHFARVKYCIGQYRKGKRAQSKGQAPAPQREEYGKGPLQAMIIKHKLCHYQSASVSVTLYREAERAWCHHLAHPSFAFFLCFILPLHWQALPNL